MSLFDDSLTRQGYQVKRNNGPVLEIATPDGVQTWITRRGLTCADRVAAGEPLKRHRLARQLLEMAGIPLPRAREITSSAHLRRFTEGRVNHVALLPIEDPWKGPDAHILTAEEVLEKASVPTRMWVQARPRGQSVRVLASREKSWVVITGASTPPLSQASLIAASNLAVHAVRAVPELRWAAVDVLVRPWRTRKNRPSSALLVEGLTRAPVFATDDQIVAGGFDAFVRWVAEPRCSHGITRVIQKSDPGSAIGMPV